MKRKYHLNFFKTASFPHTEIHSYKLLYQITFLRVSRVTSPSQDSSQLFTSPSQVPSLYLCDLSATRVQVADSSFHLCIHHTVMHKNTTERKLVNITRRVPVFTSKNQHDYKCDTDFMQQFNKQVNIKMLTF